MIFLFQALSIFSFCRHLLGASVAKSVSSGYEKTGDLSAGDPATGAALQTDIIEWSGLSAL